MLISQFHEEFKIGMDKMTSFNSPSMLPEDIDVILNNSIERFISQRMYGNNPRKEGFEENQKRWDDLLTLVSNYNTSVFTNSSANKGSGVSVALPADYWHGIQEDASITYLDCHNITQTKTVPVLLVTHDRWNKIVNDPFHQPNLNKVIRLGLNGEAELIIGQGATLSRYHLRYVRRPAAVQYGTAYSLPTIDVQCDLPASVHKEIIKMSVAEALDNIESRRFPIINQELTKIE